ncbi:MAG: hypothetical protein WAT19_05380 [Ferruginibacter sp.]
MKKKILIAAFIIFAGSACGQVSKDSLLKKMAIEICDGIDEKKLEGKTADEVFMEIGLNMLPVFSKYESDLKSIYGIEDVTGAEGMEKIGNDLGQKIPFVCPKFLKLVTTNKDIREGLLEKTSAGTGDADKTASTLSVNGKITAIEGNDFVYLLVKTLSGKTIKIFWLEFFPGEELVKDKTGILGKNVELQYSEKEVYNAKMKDYIKIKVIRSLALQD